MARTKSALHTDLRAINGKLALVESTASGWGDGSQGAPREHLVQNRIGANPPAVLATLRSDGVLAVIAAGPDSRLSLSVVSELSDKLDTDVKLSFDRMMASDLSGRARAFQSMVGGGMDVAKAAALAGLMESD